MALFRYFKRKGNSEKLPINIFNSEVRSAIDSSNSKKRGQYGKYTPEQKAMIGKRAAEHDVVYTGSNLVPQLFSKLEATALREHEGCGLDLTRQRICYHESLQIRASTKILPPEKYPLYGNKHFCFVLHESVPINPT